MVVKILFFYISPHISETVHSRPTVMIWITNRKSHTQSNMSIPMALSDVERRDPMRDIFWLDLHTARPPEIKFGM